MKLKACLLLLVALLPAGVSRCAQAATPCNFFDAAFKMGPPVHTPDGSCLVWFCSNNHGWDTYWLCSAPSGITGAVIDHLNGLTQSSQAQRDNEWAALIANPPAAGTAEDRLLKEAAKTLTPQDAPLDGFVTQHTEVYKQRLALNTYSLVVYGSVALGLPCDATHHIDDPVIGRVFTIDNSKVKRLSAFDPLPAVLYARCQP